MISRPEFESMRLSNYFSREEIRALAQWEFAGRTWTGEAVGFTEWLYPPESPGRLGSLSIDMAADPPATVDAVMGALQLGLARGQTSRELTELLGPPRLTLVLVPGRETLEWHLGPGEPWLLSGTVCGQEGLTYVVLTVRAVLPQGSAAG